MANNNQVVSTSELADELLANPEWEQWLAEHPEAAADVVVLRQARLLAAELRTWQIAVPADFEARVMAQVHRDATVGALLSLGLPQLGSALLSSSPRSSGGCRSRRCHVCVVWHAPTMHASALARGLHPGRGGVMSASLCLPDSEASYVEPEGARR